MSISLVSRILVLSIQGRINSFFDQQNKRLPEQKISTPGTGRSNLESRVIDTRRKKAVELTVVMKLYKTKTN